MASLSACKPQKDGIQKAIVLLSNKPVALSWLTVIIEQLGFVTITIDEKIDLLKLECVAVELILFDSLSCNSLIEQNLRKLESLTQAPVLYILDANHHNLHLEELFQQCEDFILKPFCPEELLLRIKKVLARHKQSQLGLNKSQIVDHIKLHPQQNTSIKQPYFIVDENACIVKVEGKPIHLTPKEYKLFSLFASKVGHIFSNQEIINTLWSDCNDATDKDVQQYIYSLRKKIEPDSATPRYLINELGFGYKLDARKTIRSS